MLAYEYIFRCSTLLEIGATVNAEDYRSFTPLHYAAKAGSIPNIQLLIDHHCESCKPCDVSAQGHRLKTPLHKARLPEVVTLLLDNGAKPYARILEKTLECDQHDFLKNMEKHVDGEQKDPIDNRCMCLRYRTDEEKETMLQGEVLCYANNSSSVFGKLVNCSSSSADALMNQMISHNGFEKDSKNYVIIYDLEIFQQESVKKNNEIDDLQAHRKILQLKSDALLHPLSTMMLMLKWKSVSPIFWLVCLQYAMYVLSLSFLAIFEANFPKWFGHTLIPASNSTKKDNISRLQDEPFAMAISYSHESIYWSFIFVYIFLMIQTMILISRELSQLICNFKVYITSIENIMEFLMLTLTGVYLIALMTCGKIITKHLAAWSVFFSWIEVILLVGRDPRASVYIHMFTTVLRVLLRCVIIYSPALIAFSFSFHILMPNNDVFVDPGSSFLKIFTMMLGEMEYYPLFAPNSEYTEAHGYSAIGSTQLVFVLFMISVGIIIVNLLVGLTIGELSTLMERARAIQLQHVAIETTLIEDIWNRKNPLMNWIFIPIAKLFGYLDLSLFQYIKLKKDGHLKDNEDQKSFKVCVVPYERRTCEWFSGIGRSIGESSHYYNVYVYDEDVNLPKLRTCRRKTGKLPLKIGDIPSSVVVRSQEIISQRMEQQRKKKDFEENLNDLTSSVENKTAQPNEKENTTNEASLLRKIDRLENKIDEILTKSYNTG